jgi:hypothetical protein
MTARKVSHAPDSLTPVVEIQRKSINALRRYVSARDEDSWRKTPYLRAVAEQFVILRELFLNERGEPDWRGQTWEYKQAVQEVFTLGGIPSDEHETVSAAIRYHVGNILRDKLDESEITGIGLRVAKPSERGNERRARQQETLAKLQGAGKSASADLLSSSLAMLSEVEPDSIRMAGIRERHEIEKLLRKLAREVAALQEKI